MFFFFRIKSILSEDSYSKLTASITKMESLTKLSLYFE